MEKKLDQWKDTNDVLQAYLRARDCSWESPVDVDGVQVSSSLDARGREVPDEIPVAPPVGYSSGPSLADFVQRMIRTEVSRIAEDNSFESFEESDDFTIDDDPIDPLTPYEEVFVPRRGGGGAEPPSAKPTDGGTPAKEAAPSSEPLPMPSPLAKSEDQR